MFVKVIKKSTLVTFFLLMLSVLAGLILLRWPEATATGINRGLNIAVTILIPSLFPFMVLAGFVVKTGISDAIGRRLEKPMNFLFGLPGCCAAGIIMSLVGGFPTGAIIINELLKKEAITKAQAKKMLCFTVNAGPAFTISAIGVSMMGSMKLGIILYISHVTTSLIIGFCLRGFSDSKTPSSSKIVNPRLSPTSAFVDAVKDGCSSMILMCGFLILFSAVLSVIDGTGITHAISEWAKDKNDFIRTFSAVIVPGFLEVSCGSIAATKAGMFAPFLLSFILGWSGLSVHFQVAATIRGRNIMSKNFFFAKFLHGFLSGALTILILKFIPITLPVSNSNDTPVKLFHTSVYATSALFLVCIIFIFTLAGRLRGRSLEDNTPKGNKKTKTFNI